MRRVWLDFVKPAPGHKAPGWTMLAVALALTAGLVVYDVDLNERIAELEGRSHSLQRRVDRERLAAGPTEGASATGEDLAKQIAARSTARWEELFAALEAAADDTVTLLSLHPEGGSLTMVGEAKHLAAATDYLKRLKGQARFGNAYLADYESVRDHPQHPVRFTIVAPGGETS